jgi:D-sedoheptulose 7-phosphate isomerase
MNNPITIAQNNIRQHLSLMRKTKKDFVIKIREFSKVIEQVLRNNGKVFIFGNGGSAADSQHFAAELVVKLKNKRKAIPALALTTDSSIITAIGNDYSFKKIFSRQLEAFAKKEDVAIAISTSGKSKNIVDALRYCRKKKIKTIGILGSKGVPAKKFCDNFYLVPSNISSRVQEVHIIFWQTLCEVIESDFIV